MISFENKRVLLTGGSSGIGEHARGNFLIMAPK